MVDRLLSPLISTSDIDNTLLPPYQPLSYFTRAHSAGSRPCLSGLADGPCLPPLHSSVVLESFTPVTPLSSLSEVIGQPCATTCLFDPMPTVLRKTVTPELLPFIVSLINTSLPSGHVPLQFKMTVVTKHPPKNRLK